MLYTGNRIGGSNPPLSAVRDTKPFNERVEGLSRCYATLALSVQSSRELLLTSRADIHRLSRSIGRGVNRDSSCVCVHPGQQVTKGAPDAGRRFPLSTMK